MKKLGLVLGLGLLSASSLFADYQLTLIDKDGTETKQCIKSYSFSNNLKSLARKNGVGFKDVYSEEETMTNKVFMGKPVYRKIATIPTLKARLDWPVQVSYNNPPTDVETLLTARILGEEGYGESQSNSGIYTLYYTLRPTELAYVAGSSRVQFLSDKKVLLEYTKTTDEVNSPSNNFKSYLHYVPSSSITNEVSTVDLEDKGVKFLKNYTYDVDTDSCTDN